MRVLALDISTKTGWAIVEQDENDQILTPVDFGNVVAKKKVGDLGQYPWNYVDMATDMSNQFMFLIDDYEPDAIVVEETNKAKSRYTQKQLEFIHYAFLYAFWDSENTQPIYYINTSDWRKTMGIYMTKEDKKNNAKVNKAKRQGVSKKDLGLKGKITRKHIAIRAVKEKFGLPFKQKDNDIAEAICLGVAYLLHTPVCDGKK